MLIAAAKDILMLISIHICLRIFVFHLYPTSVREDRPWDCFRLCICLIWKQNTRIFSYKNEVSIDLLFNYVWGSKLFFFCSYFVLNLFSKLMKKCWFIWTLWPLFCLRSVSSYYPKCWLYVKCQYNQAWNTRQLL